MHLACKIDARAGHGVFADIAEKIIKYTPQKLSVRQNLRIFGRELHDGLELTELKPALVLARDLRKKHIHIDRFQMHRQRAARCFGRFNQILGQLFQPCRLAVEDGNILLCLLRLHILFFEKVDIVDDRGQRRFDVV